MMAPMELFGMSNQESKIILTNSLNITLTKLPSPNSFRRDHIRVLGIHNPNGAPPDIEFLYSSRLTEAKAIGSM